jgi:FAD/FMN-containing dehydrogenase
MQPHLAQAIYINYKYVSDEKESRVREFYGQNLRRLAELKAKYDPGNLFRMGALPRV